MNCSKKMPQTTFWLMGVCTLLSGCTYGGGELLYFLNPFPEKKIPARFELGEGTLLILVDDDYELVTWPPTKSLLIDEIAGHLEKAKPKIRVPSSDAVDRLQNSITNYSELPLSEIGRQMNADLILWIQVRDYYASTTLRQTTGSARLSVCIKVFDPDAESRDQLRVWPESREGEFASIEKSASALQPYDSDEAIARMLTQELAKEIAELFYDHRPDES